MDKKEALKQIKSGDISLWDVDKKLHTEEKLITQISNDDLSSILDCLDNLKVYVREYDYAGDY